MRTQDAAAKVLELAPLLDPALMRARLAEYSKFGLPSGGGDGRGSAESPLPMLGTTDRQILVARREYEQALTHAALALETAIRYQRAWTVPRTDDSEKDRKLADEKPGKPCSNIWCDHVCTGIQNDRLRNGRCQACDQHFRRHGVERDPRPRDESNQPVTPRRAV